MPRATMTRDLRWSGGIANREWSRGSRSVPVEVDQVRLAGEVRRYLADCTAAIRSGIKLDPQYHPTARGAVKAIYCRHSEEAEFVKSLL